ncbi:MAG: hydrogenase [Bacteroidetes bacterium]|nr:MAG: hydrogenase [Bacteroidota bacterium]REK34595.1 MAG: hydrogenase [Bacteroidota bacterium]
MIVKRIFNPIKVIQYVKTEFTFAVAIAVTVYSLHKHGVTAISFPFSIAAILGSALAIFIAFRNNSSYSRWWEARTLWGGIINSSRVIARLIITLTDSHAHQQNYDKTRSEQFKEVMIYKVIAWVHALRLHLRKQDNWQDLTTFFSDQEFNELQNSQNKPNFIHLISGKKIYEAMANGTIGGFDSFQMEGQLLALANYQGGCERIKNTPLLRQYDFFTRVFLYTFMLLLPFSLIGDFTKMNIDYLMIPVSITISFVFAIINKVGEVNEDPFENRITDVPLTAMCNTIERDLREMLGETNLPNKLEPENGLLF